PASTALSSLSLHDALPISLLSRPLRHTLAVALALAAAPAFAQDDSPYSDTVFIGDSLTDAGYFRPVLLQVVGPSGALIGKFTTKDRKSTRLNSSHVKISYA